MADKKKLAVMVLGVGAAITGAIALWWFYLRTPSTECTTPGATRCLGNVSQICTDGVWVAGGGRDCSTGSQGQLRVETIPPGDVDIYVDDGFVDSWGVDWVAFAVGNHVLSFQNPRGSPCVPPAAYTFEIRANTTTVLKIDCLTGTVQPPEYYPM